MAKMTMNEITRARCSKRIRAFLYFFQMSGKSFFVTQLARNWENNIALEPLSQIWLIAQSISPGMRERLTETAKELGIPIYFCPGGTS